jgi:ferredoxin-like protein FixX
VARKLQQTENAKHNIKYKKFTLHLYNPNRRYDILNNTHDKKEKAYCVECGYMRYIGTEEECINWINKNKF